MLKRRCRPPPAQRCLLPASLRRDRPRLIHGTDKAQGNTSIGGWRTRTPHLTDLSNLSYAAPRSISHSHKRHYQDHDPQPAPSQPYSVPPPYWGRAYRLWEENWSSSDVTQTNASSRNGRGARW
jgi:hypothetical protein